MPHDKILNVAVVSGAIEVYRPFVEFVSRQKYAVACPVNTHDGIVMVASTTVMFCVC